MLLHRQVWPQAIHNFGPAASDRPRQLPCPRISCSNTNSILSTPCFSVKFTGLCPSGWNVDLNDNTCANIRAQCIDNCSCIYEELYIYQGQETYCCRNTDSSCRASTYSCKPGWTQGGSACYKLATQDCKATSQGVFQSILTPKDCCICRNSANWLQEGTATSSSSTGTSSSSTGTGSSSETTETDPGKDCTGAGSNSDDVCWDPVGTDSSVESQCVLLPYDFMKKYSAKYRTLDAHACNKAACADCAADSEGGTGDSCFTVAHNVCTYCCGDSS